MRAAAPKAKRSTKVVWTGNRPAMKHSDFWIGREFLSGSGRWRCTDVGTRTVAAIKLDMDHDPAWYNGPPYAVAESIFDEYAIGSPLFLGTRVGSGRGETPSRRRMG